MTPESMILILGALFSGMAGLIAAVMTNRTAATKSQVEILTNTLTMLQLENRRLCERVEHLEKEIDEREAELSALKEWAELLVDQVKRLGDHPIPVPERKTKPRRQE